MSNSVPHLGIIDWGIGGVSVLKLIIKQMGDIPVTYFSDTGVTPYGKMSRTELSRRLDRVIQFLIGRGITHVVIGCNAASTAIPRLSGHGIPIAGVIDSAIEAAAELRPQRLGLIGGRRTVVSGAYKRAFARRGIPLAQRIAQPLSGLIESGDISSDVLRSEAQRILAPIRRCSHILLACTHYPAITPVLQAVAPNAIFIDPAPALVLRIKEWGIEPGGKQEFLTTGDREMMKVAAHKAFDFKVAEVGIVTV